MHEAYMRSKIPVGLILLFLLNVMLIIALEVMFFYQLPARIDETALAAMNPQYHSCMIRSEDHANSLSCYLVEQEDGSLHLVSTRKHGLFFTRAKKIDDTPVSVSEGERIPVKIGVHTAEITYHNRNTITIFHYTEDGFRSAGTLYMVLGAILEGLELALYQLLKGK